MIQALFTLNSAPFWRLLTATLLTLTLGAGPLQAATGSTDKSANNKAQAPAEKSSKSADAREAKSKPSVRTPVYNFPETERLPNRKIDPLAKTIQRNVEEHWKNAVNGREVRGEIRELEGMVQKNKQRFHATVKDLELEEKSLERLKEAAWKAQQDLAETRSPATNAMRAYRKAQNLSLGNPAISTEANRLAYLHIKTELKEVVETKENALRIAREQVAHSHKRIGHITDKLRRLTDETLQVQNRLYRMREVSFVRLARN
ncbi:MAG: hypothetical protein HQL53_02770 [Magnetococcales bacterium]|nr:hypothetical protein [Magnetococcales bacterium]